MAVGRHSYPSQSLIDAYEMKDGLTIEEAQAKGEYNPEHPYKDRDPRFYATNPLLGC